MIHRKTGINLNSELYLTQAIRECEHSAYASGIKEGVLMERAGDACFQVLQNFFPEVRRILVFCGHGNNAGDGFVLARLAHLAGYDVLVNHIKSLEYLPDDARHFAQLAMDAGVSFHFWDEESPEFDAELIIDALLGIGLQGAVREPYHSVISYVNEAELPVLSVDIPSGLNADTGCVMGICVRADVTVTLIGLKLGMYTCDGPDYCGRIILNTLKLPPAVFKIPASVQIISSPDFSNVLRSRLRNTHKGAFGHVLVVGGGMGMPGAAWLVAEAALRIGAGLVTIATHPLYASFLSAQLPEAMVYGIVKPQELESLLKKATVCVLGPGLGSDTWADALFHEVMHYPLPMIIDASALTILSKHPQFDDHWILTPHPGEAAILLGSNTTSIQNNRLLAIRQLRERYGGTVVLKGVGTLVGNDDDSVYLCTAGNPGMSTAGMGDVLSGIIGGLMAQGLSMSQAARVGVYLHARAADCCAEDFGERGMLAHDILSYVRKLVNDRSKLF